MKKEARRIGQGMMLVLFCLSGCVTAGTVAAHSTTRPGRTAAAEATNYYRAVVAQNYRLAFTYLAAKVTGPNGRRLILPAYLQLARMLDGQGGPVTSFSVGAFHAMVVMTIYRKKYGPYHAHLQMMREKNGWIITSIDRI